MAKPKKPPPPMAPKKPARGDGKSDYTPPPKGTDRTGRGASNRRYD